MREITLKELLEAGCHFGHKAARWMPKAVRYIYAKRDGVHIIDLTQTKSGLEAAGVALSTIASSGGNVIFVGAKRQSKAVMEEAAKRAGVYYLSERWAGGLLTNFSVLKRNLERIKELEEKLTDETYTKKEKLLAKRDMEKMLTLYGGLQGMEVLPQAIFVVDAKKFAGAIKEARATGVKIVAIADTNIDPDLIDFPIPANDDAVGSIKIIVEYLADSWLEGKKEFAVLAEKAKKEAEKKEAAEKKKKEAEQETV